MADRTPVSSITGAGESTVLTDVKEKRQYFNRYWQTRDLPSADARSAERAEIVRYLLGHPAGQEVLDVGCGRGAVLRYLSRYGFQVSGCDVATDNLKALKAEGLPVFEYDIERDTLHEKYDVILCLEVLQQLFDPAEALTKFAHALKADGCMMISVPNEFHIWARLRLLLGTSRLGHFDESHIRLFNPRRARELFMRVGFRIEATVNVSAIPPRWKLLKPLGNALMTFLPGLFVLSQIYKLRPGR